MPTIGQDGAKDAGMSMPSRRDPLFQLASMLGIMAGDRYQPTPFAEEMANEIDLLNPTQPSRAAVTEQAVVDTDTVTVGEPEPDGDGPLRPPTVRTVTPARSRTRRDDPRQADPLPRQSFGAGILQAATRYLDIPYLYGGTDPRRGLDCSGFVQRVFADMGVALPRVTYDQVRVGQAINDRNQLRPGDLIFFIGDRGNRVNGHVGIYTGDGMMVDAPYTGARVGYRRVQWNRMTAMRRVIP